MIFFILLGYRSSFCYDLSYKSMFLLQIYGNSLTREFSKTLTRVCNAAVVPYAARPVHYYGRAMPVDHF
jgi:hypothetical protein